MVRPLRPGYWDGRDAKQGASRGHPDDEAHRRKVGEIILATHQASGSRSRHRSFSRPTQYADWRYSSLQRWARDGHLNNEFVFEGLEDLVPAELAAAPDGETPEQERERAKKILAAVRLAKGVSQLAMDVLLDQQYTVYSNFERRLTDFQVAAMQRAVRALGGVFRVELTHKHNPGMLKRIS